MRAKLTAIAVTGLVLIGSAPSPALAADAPCPQEVKAALGYCPALTTDQNRLDVSGVIDTPGRTGGDDGSRNPSTPINPLADCTPLTNDRQRCDLFGRPIPVTAATPTITITDLASFAPEPVTLSAEPDNVGIADMPANFLAAASVHTQTGTLFGQPLSVRFTPVGYEYTYGDGTTASLTAAGRTWAELAQAQFTPTPTSHVYADRGIYDADVDVRYTAEIDFGAGWYPIDGELTTDGPAQQIRIFEAHTALVAYTCSERPTAPGC